MSTYASLSPLPTKKRRRVVGIAIVAVLLGAMALDTTIVKIGSDADNRQAGFSAESFGAEQFPLIRDDVTSRAVDAVTLAKAISTDQQAASEQYGVATDIGPVMPVSFSGVVGEGKSGIYNIEVEGLPDSLGIRLQTGPAINGTDLRDATGTIKFGQFTNQIEYQNAGSAINNEMKKQLLADIDTSSLSGKSIRVIGVFKLINPDNWLVTPVSLELQ